MAQNRANRGRTVPAIIGSLLCLVLLASLLDPLPWISDMVNSARVRWQLPRARSRWESHGLSSYRIRVKGAVPLACFIDGELTVRDGRLVEVRMRENPLVPDSPLVLVDHGNWRRQGCAYEDLTVGRMFERVERALSGVASLGTPLVVQFDEEMGFITEYRFGRSSRGGVFGYVTSECCTWFEFEGLTPSTP